MQLPALWPHGSPAAVPERKSLIAQTQLAAWDTLMDVTTGFDASELCIKDKMPLHRPYFRTVSSQWLKYREGNLSRGRGWTQSATFSLDC